MQKTSSKNVEQEQSYGNVNNVVEIDANNNNINNSIKNNINGDTKNEGNKNDRFEEIFWPEAIQYQ